MKVGAPFRPDGVPGGTGQTTFLTAGDALVSQVLSVTACA